MQPREQFILLMRLWRQVWPDDILQPVAKEPFEGRNVRRDRATIRFVPEFQPGPPGIFVGLGLDILAVALTRRIHAPHIPAVATP